MVSACFRHPASSFPMSFSLPAELPAVNRLDRTSAIQRNRNRDAQSAIDDFSLPATGHSSLRGGAVV